MNNFDDVKKVIGAIKNEVNTVIGAIKNEVNTAIVRFNNCDENNDILGMHTAIGCMLTLREVSLTLQLVDLHNNIVNQIDKINDGITPEEIK